MDIVGTNFDVLRHFQRDSNFPDQFVCGRPRHGPSFEADFEFQNARTTEDSYRLL